MSPFQSRDPTLTPWRRSITNRSIYSPDPPFTLLLLSEIIRIALDKNDTTLNRILSPSSSPHQPKNSSRSFTIYPHRPLLRPSPIRNLSQTFPNPLRENPAACRIFLPNSYNILFPFFIIIINPTTTSNQTIRPSLFFFFFFFFHYLVPILHHPPRNSPPRRRRRSDQSPLCFYPRNRSAKSKFFGSDYEAEIGVFGGFDGWEKYSCAAASVGEWCCWWKKGKWRWVGNIGDFGLEWCDLGRWVDEWWVLSSFFERKEYGGVFGGVFGGERAAAESAEEWGGGCEAVFVRFFFSLSPFPFSLLSLDSPFTYSSIDVLYILFGSTDQNNPSSSSSSTSSPHSHPNRYILYHSLLAIIRQCYRPSSSSSSNSSNTTNEESQQTELAARRNLTNALTQLSKICTSRWGKMRGGKENERERWITLCKER